MDPASPEESEVEDGNEEQLEDEDYEEEEMSDDFYLDEKPTKFSSLKEYYQQASEGKTTLETLLIMFCHHLQDINGGACNEKQAMVHAQNVRKLHEALDPKGQDRDNESLVKDGGTFLWRNWAKPLLDSKKRDLAQSDLTSALSQNSANLSSITQNMRSKDCLPSLKTPSNV